MPFNAVIRFFRRARPRQNNPVLDNVASRFRETTNGEGNWNNAWPRPKIFPTKAEYHAALGRLCDESQCLVHIAVVGPSRSGKSSFVNSVRGLGPQDPKAVRVAEVETTRIISRYEDPDPEKPIAWYDIPGYGTDLVPAEGYFNSQGLFAFDCIVVIVQVTLKLSDIQLIKQCDQLNIPTYIVRSKCDMAIASTARRSQLPTDEAKSKLAVEQLNSFLPQLGDGPNQVAALPWGRRRDCHLINKKDILALIKGQPVSEMAIDETKLLENIAADVAARRG